MGAKLSKKKKGYCLGAGKDGESTETTEVEQKETENQEGQKDAAEPKGEKAPTDQSQNNGVNEEPKDKKSGGEVTTGDTTKDDESNQDQKPEIKTSTEQKKAEEKEQLHGKKEHEGKRASSAQECEKEKVKNVSEDKTKTECEVKETLAVSEDKPTQESTPVKEKDPDCKQSHVPETKQLTTVQDEVWVKTVSEPVTKVEAEQTEKAPASVVTEVHVSEKAAEVPTKANKSVVENEKLEKVPEKVEPSAPESMPVEPVSEPVVASEPVIKIEVAETAFSKPAQLMEVAKPEAVVVLEKVDSALPNSDPTSEPVHSELPKPVAEPVEPKQAPEPEPSPVPEPDVKPKLPEAVPEIKIESADPEQPTALPEQNVKQERDPETVPCPASEKISETKQEQELTSEPLPPKATEVPDESADAKEATENQASLGCSDQGADVVKIQAPTTEAASIKQPLEITEQHAAPEAPVIQNGPSENSSEDDHIEAHPISIELKVEDKVEQNKAVEENGGLDKLPTQQESPVVKEDCKVPIEVLVTSKNENEYTPAQDPKETHNASQHCNSEDKTENHNTSAEQEKNENESPAPEILEKHGVGNGLPLKEEIKVNLENKCDKDLHDIYGQSESHEIQVCNE